MRNLKDISETLRMEEFNYSLPDEAIAQYPLEERDASRLICLRGEVLEEDKFTNIDRYIPQGSLMVFNNTKVIRARFIFQKETGSFIEIFCIEPLNPSDYQKNLAAMLSVEWKCIVGNLKKWKNGTLQKTVPYKGSRLVVSARKTGDSGDVVSIRFSWDPPHLSFGEVMEIAGLLPLPPYIRREADENDALRYQTLLSRFKGSVAAPTAGLHFSGDLLGRIRNSSISTAEITLHVGAGTFKPVRTNIITDHEMHSENFITGRKVIEMIAEYENRIIAVGTTSVRTLETLYWLGVKLLIKKPDNDETLILNQWEEYGLDPEIPVGDSMKALLDMMNNRGSDQIQASTRIMIVPGYEFRIVNGLITNFHQPESSLLLLVAALIGERWKDVYGYALKNNFRFLSYGDSSLLFR